MVEGIGDGSMGLFEGCSTPGLESAEIPAGRHGRGVPGVRERSGRPAGTCSRVAYLPPENPWLASTRGRDCPYNAVSIHQFPRPSLPRFGSTVDTTASRWNVVRRPRHSAPVFIGRMEAASSESGRIGPIDRHTTTNILNGGSQRFRTRPSRHTPTEPTVRVIEYGPDAAVRDEDVLLAERRGRTVRSPEKHRARE